MSTEVLVQDVCPESSCPFCKIEAPLQEIALGTLHRKNPEVFRIKHVLIRERLV